MEEEEEEEEEEYEELDAPDALAEEAEGIPEEEEGNDAPSPPPLGLSTPTDPTLCRGAEEERVRVDDVRTGDGRCR
jgi:hypothetical protein